jgi:hypothetical protein
MKRALALLTTLILFLTSFTVLSLEAAAPSVKTTVYTCNDLKKLPSESSFENNFIPATAKWLSQVGGDQPATFAKDKIKYTLAPGVTKIDHISEKLADAGQLLSGSTAQKLSPGRIVEKGGYISKAVLDNAAGKVL